LLSFIKAGKKESLQMMVLLVIKKNIRVA